jgi:AcrR family transcriptional regulator
MKDAADGERALRADAARNRGRILKAAQKAFAEHGLDVPLEDVAERAGVGIGTVYRRFPTRDDLIVACFEHRLEEYALAAEEALQAPDGWSGFRGYVERICGMQAADRGLKDVLTRTFPDARALEAHRARGYELSVRLIERAQAEGTLRSDLVPEDLVLLLMANAGVVQGMGTAAPDGPRRFVALLLDGLRSEGATELPLPPSPRQVVRAMRGLRSRGTR